MINWCNCTGRCTRIGSKKVQRFGIVCRCNQIGKGKSLANNSGASESGAGAIGLENEQVGCFGIGRRCNRIGRYNRIRSKIIRVLRNWVQMQSDWKRNELGTSESGADAIGDEQNGFK
jgi:hypothetical protein